MFNLANKAAFVTGGASGIGAAIARCLAEAGANVWIADRDREQGVASATQAGARFVALDVSDPRACSDVAVEVGRIDILANVAGIGHVGTLLGTTPDDLDRLLAVNSWTSRDALCARPFARIP